MAVGRVVRNFRLSQLVASPHHKSAVLINPPVYDTQYWADSSQPYGLLRVGALLRQCGCKRVGLFDFIVITREVKETNGLCTYC